MAFPTYRLAKFLTKILQQFCGNNLSFIKDSKSLAELIKGQKVAPDETLVSFSVSALFTSIPVPAALEVINRNFMEHIDEKGSEHFMEKLLSHYLGQIYLIFWFSSYYLCLIPSEKILPTTPRGCIGFFSIPQLLLTPIWSTFEGVALGPECPIPSLWWKRYMNDVISIVRKKQVDTLFNQLNSFDLHIKFTMESPGTDGNIPFLDAECLHNKDHSIQTLVCRKPTNWYLDWNFNHPISVKNQ